MNTWQRLRNLWPGYEVGQLVQYDGLQKIVARSYSGGMWWYELSDCKEFVVSEGVIDFHNKFF